MTDEPTVEAERRWVGWALLAAGLVVTAVGLILALTMIPGWLYPPLPAAVLGQVSDPARRIELESNRLKLQNDARATMLQGLAGVAVLGGAIIAARQLRLAHEQLQQNREQLQQNFQNSQEQLQAGQKQLELNLAGQITERFSRAIDQLGTQDQLEVVMGGIYALERIARDSPDDRDRATVAEVLTAYVRTHSPWPPGHPGQPAAATPTKELPQLQTRAPDVHAALTVLGRGKFATQLDLHGTDLRGAGLADANLQGAMLDLAGLQGAWLGGANLQGARLLRTNLEGANLQDANLQEAIVAGANFQDAWLMGAKFQGAIASNTTTWPDEFDPDAAGVLPIAIDAGGTPPV